MSEKSKDPSMREISRLGASKGGYARAKSMSARRRKEISEKAAAARWAGLTPKERSLQAKSWASGLTPEERSERVKRAWETRRRKASQ